MPVSQIGKAKATANIFRSTCFWIAIPLGMPSWRHWTTNTPEQTHAKKNPISQFLDCRSEPHYWPKPQVALALLSRSKHVISKLLSEDFRRQPITGKDPNNFSKRQKPHFCVTVQDFTSCLSSFLSAERCLAASLQKALWDARCNMHVNYH